MKTESAANSKVQPITLATYNDKYGSDSVASLFVLNRTEPRGNVMFSAQNDMGQPATVVVPATFIPIDLTTQATKESLLKSTYFRRCLTMQQLVIIDNESAERYLSTNKLAQSEMRKLNKMDDSIAADLKSIERIEDLGEIDLGGGRKKQQQPHFEGADQLSSNQFVNAFIVRAAEDSGETDENLEREFLNKGINLPANELETQRQHISRPAIVELIMQALEDAN